MTPTVTEVEIMMTEKLPTATSSPPEHQSSRQEQRALGHKHHACSLRGPSWWRSGQQHSNQQRADAISLTFESFAYYRPLGILKIQSLLRVSGQF